MAPRLNTEMYLINGCSDIKTSSNGYRLKRLRVVSFVCQEDLAIVHEDPAVSLSDDEIAACWYSQAELETIRLQIKETVEIFKRQAVEHRMYDFCIRGLESRVSLQKSRRQTQNRLTAWTAVLEEQALQWEQCNDDPILLAKIYMASSERCRDEARQAGILDECDAKTNNNR